MLAAELGGEAYTKAERRRRLLPLLTDRSEAAIDRKHGNISAVLLELGYPYIEGYKPYANYQQLLFDVVFERVGSTADLEKLVAADVELVISIPTVDDILSAMVPPPKPSKKARERSRPPPWTYGSSAHRLKVNHLLREASNAALGAAGEDFAVNYERARLLAAGHDRLADSIEHVSKMRGDGDGFDILSFDETGRERLIEVKTTKYGAQTPFFVTRNEVEVSEREADRYHCYRLYAFRDRPKLFSVKGALSRTFELNPTKYTASIR